MARSNCPHLDVLHAFSNGKMQDEAAVLVVDHLDTCRECDSTVEELGHRSGSFLDGLRHLASTGAYDDEPECRLSLELVEKIAARAHRVPAGSTRDELPEGNFLGPYRLEARIGGGAHGTIYRAFHTKLGRMVALKTLQTHRPASAEARERFQREMLAVGRLSHPHIVHAHDAGEVDGILYLAMEYLEETDLSHLMRRHGPLRMADACEVVRQAALGLHHAHEHHLIHRDVKPSNLMLTIDTPRTDHGEGILSHEPIVKVLDLGLAWLLESSGPPDDLTHTDVPLGTAKFTSPEQINDSRNVDARSDVYGLGCTLYYLLAGEAPFDGPRYGNAYQLLKAHETEPVPPIAHRRPDLPRELIGILERMLAKMPAQRFSTALLVAEAIKPWTVGNDLRVVLYRSRLAMALFKNAYDGPPRPSNLSRRPRRAVVQQATTPSASGIDETKVALDDSAKTAPAVSPPSRQAAATRPRRKSWLAAWSAIVLLIVAGVIYVTVTPDGFEIEADAVHIYPGGEGAVKVEVRSSKVPPAASAEAAPPTLDAQRQVAEWVLSRGGEIELHPHAVVTRGKDLPQATFQLRKISLTSSGLTDQDLARFAPLTTLHGLVLSDNPFTDKGFLHLLNNKSLRWLYVGGTRITDQSVAEIAEFRQLENLDLAKTSITDLGLVKLHGLTAIRELRLSETRVTDGFLAHLEQWPNLMNLDLSATAISDQGLQHLLRASHLKKLNLQATGVSSAGVDTLLSLKQLQWLNLKETSLSAESRLALRTGLPGCRIDFD